MKTFFAVVFVSLNLFGCAVETKQDRQFVKSDTQTPSVDPASGAKPSESIQSPQRTASSNSTGTDIKPQDQADSKATTNPPVQEKPTPSVKPLETSPVPNTGATTPVERTGAKGTCAEGKVPGPNFTVNTESGVNVRKEGTASAERIGGFGNGTALVSWKDKDSQPTSLQNWQCVTGKESDGKELTGWVTGVLLK